MLSRLIATYAFAVQPDMGLAFDFALRLAETLTPPQRVLRLTTRYVNDMMNWQHLVLAMDMRLPLPW